MAEARPGPGRLRVALGGGVGSGKSTLGVALADLGGYRIDADQVAREVVEPGTPGLEAVVARFGPDVRDADGRLDRAALAAVVFADDQARAELNGILHPLIKVAVQAKMDASPPDSVVVYEVPLLQATGLEEFDYVVVVVAPAELRIARLAGRGMGEADARARMAAQITDDELRALADEVVVNDGDTDDLRAKAGELWGRLDARSVARRPDR